MSWEAERDARQILETVWAPGVELANLQLPVDPFEIARRLGIKVFTAGLDEGVSGMLWKRAGEDPEIFLNSKDGANRQRFTCAHELGHYVGRSETGDNSYEYIEHRDLISSQGADGKEIYANQFAASLLMPGEAVDARADQATAASLAYEFGVSPEAMHFRLENLGKQRDVQRVF